MAKRKATRWYGDIRDEKGGLGRPGGGPVSDDWAQAVQQLPRNWEELQAGTFHPPKTIGKVSGDVRDGPFSRALLWLNAQREAGINPWREATETTRGGPLAGTDFSRGKKGGGMERLSRVVDDYSLSPGDQFGPAGYGRGGTWLGYSRHQPHLPPTPDAPTQSEVEQARIARGGRGSALLAGRNIAGGSPVARRGAAEARAREVAARVRVGDLSQGLPIWPASAAASGRTGGVKRRRGAALTGQSLGAPRGKQLLGV